MTAPAWAPATVFAVVYIGMFLGGLPRLKLDRTGVAVLGAIAMLPLTGLPLHELAAQAIDLPTLVLLFAFMVLAAQLQLGGFTGALVHRLGGSALSPRALLAVLIALAALVSAVFSNDVACLAMAPALIALTRRRGLQPLPYLVALACASNIGSALTLIGNPQNMLIGSVLKLPFAAYLQTAALPVGLSLLLLWAWLAPRLQSCAPQAATEAAPALDRWQSAKGLLVAGLLMAVFLLTDWPREAAALVGAGVLLLSTRLHSRDVMGFVDWPLLLLFIGLFIVNHGFAQTGYAAQAVAHLAAQGVHLHEPGPLTLAAVLLSNLVSNVPAVMLLLPHLGPDPQAAGTLLALISTFAGNLLLIGSIANLIVADAAERQGIVIDGRSHLKLAAPVALGSLAIGVAALQFQGA
jgi:Na+/H+ antiporter NhaD/arsenite permease-like protein